MLSWGMLKVINKGCSETTRTIYSLLGLCPGCECLSHIQVRPAHSTTPLSTALVSPLEGPRVHSPGLHLGDWALSPPQRVQRPNPLLRRQPKYPNLVPLLPIKGKLKTLLIVNICPFMNGSCSENIQRAYW